MFSLVDFLYNDKLSFNIIHNYTLVLYMIIYFFKFYLFIWLCQVLAAIPRIFVVTMDLL